METHKMCTQTPKISVKFLLGQELAQGGGKNKHKLVLQGLRFLRLFGRKRKRTNPASHTLVEPAP